MGKLNKPTYDQAFDQLMQEVSMDMSALARNYGRTLPEVRADVVRRLSGVSDGAPAQFRTG